MDTCLNRKNDALHTTYHTPHTVSVTIQQPQNVTGPRLGPRTLDRTSTGINSRSMGGHQHVGQKSSGRLKTLVHFVCFWIYDHPLILCPFLPTLVVRNWYVVHISPSPHYTYLVPQFLYMCFHRPVHPGPRQYVGMLYWQSCPFHRYSGQQNRSNVFHFWKDILTPLEINMGKSWKYYVSCSDILVCCLHKG